MQASVIGEEVQKGIRGSPHCLQLFPAVFISHMFFKENGGRELPQAPCTVNAAPPNVGRGLLEKRSFGEGVFTLPQKESGKRNLAKSDTKVRKSDQK